MFKGQSTSANIICGPIINVSGSVMTGRAIANTAIWVVKEAGVSTARSHATSALSVAPGTYRIPINTTDSDTLGTLYLFVSVSGALPWRSEIEIIQQPTMNLFFGSADAIATSAVVAGVSAAVAGVSVAVGCTSR